MKALFLTYLFTLLAFSKFSFAQTTSADSPIITPACQDFMSTEIPAYYQKGFVIVPEDWNHPEGRKIQIFYYGNIEKNNKAPIVFFNGGPGQDSHSSSGLFQTIDQAKNKTIIFIDQRGTGCSSPYPTEVSLETAQRLTLYGSRSIVKDAEAVRKKLFGTKKWKAFGQSYGGLIAHRYVSIAPEGLDSVFVHGFSVMNNWSQFYKLRMLSQKRIVENYFAKAPQDRARLESIKSQISDETCFQGIHTRVCGAGVIDSLSMILGLPDYWNQIHFTISNLLDAQEKLKMATLKRYAEMIITNNLDQIFMAGAIITKIEMNDETNQDQCAVALDLLQKEGYQLASWPLNECRFFGSLSSLDQTNQIVDIIDQIKTHDSLRIEDLANSFEKNPSLKIHLYSSGLDAYAPLETFSEESEKLKDNIIYKNLPDSGHDGFSSEPEIWDDLVK